ncbi:group II intron maturase-specific domain-containing protein [Proteiniborus sp. MB09-C3]|uniref:group II intron maturase-specific domain-containing protein n=1 Tax=Proteiniborus sp. MB09-C3 TaxID=3050072 RepID=UPI0025549609|nr:group II intron maturase-specific domain-containing protein [Proteiniborus sp. MB09-C3]WIV13673.1 group II intron maturase-specific domain-containing protein [Proteiniborus sp. MB09-C3]
MKKIIFIPAKKSLENNGKLKVAAYCRVSTERETQKSSIDTQIKYYIDLIQENPEWDFAGVFYDYESGLRREKLFNRQIQGWINYYTHFYKSEIYNELRYINRCLVNWVRRKYKKRKSRQRAEYWLGTIERRDKNLFALEYYQRLDNGSRMS